MMNDCIFDLFIHSLSSFRRKRILLNYCCHPVCSENYSIVDPQISLLMGDAVLRSRYHETPELVIHNLSYGFNVEGSHIHVFKKICVYIVLFALK